MQLKPEDNEKTPLRMEPETEKQEQEVSYNSEPKYDYNDFGNSYGSNMNDPMDDMDMFGNSTVPNNPDNIIGPSLSEVAGEEPVNTKPRKLTKKEFFESPRNRKIRDQIIISSVVIIVAAIFDWVRTSFWIQTFAPTINKLNQLSEDLGLGQEYVIDTQKIMNTQITVSLILIGLGIGIFLFKNKWCALAGLFLTVFQTIYSIIVAHQFRWYWVIIAFGYATFATFTFDKEWKDYEDHGEWQRDW